MDLKDIKETIMRKLILRKARKLFNRGLLSTVQYNLIVNNSKTIKDNIKK